MSSSNKILEVEKVVGMSYDGRRDKRTRAMVPDSFGKMRMRVITEEHESVTEEPSGQYLAHFTPEPPVHPEKPAEKVAEALYELLLKHDSTESLMLLGGDSCNTNTGYKGGTHAHLERKLGRRLFWAICNLQPMNCGISLLLLMVQPAPTLGSLVLFAPFSLV